MTLVQLVATVAVLAVVVVAVIHKDVVLEKLTALKDAIVAKFK